jgi:hypothetical protein
MSWVLLTKLVCRPAGDLQLQQPVAAPPKLNPQHLVSLLHTALNTNMFYNCATELLK